MRVTSKGQVTIPQAVRERLGIRPGTEVEITAHGDHAEIRPVVEPEGRGRELVRRLWASAPPGMSTDEVMTLTRSED